jgi:hypothetical protein
MWAATSTNPFPAIAASSSTSPIPSFGPHQASPPKSAPLPYQYPQTTLRFHVQLSYPQSPLRLSIRHTKPIIVSLRKTNLIPIKGFVHEVLRRRAYVAPLISTVTDEILKPREATSLSGAKLRPSIPYLASVPAAFPLPILIRSNQNVRTFLALPRLAGRVCYSLCISLMTCFIRAIFDGGKSMAPICCNRDPSLGACSCCTPLSG